MAKGLKGHYQRPKDLKSKFKCRRDKFEIAQ